MVLKPHYILPRCKSQIRNYQKCANVFMWSAFDFHSKFPNSIALTIGFTWHPRTKRCVFSQTQFPTKRNTHFEPHYPRHTPSANQNQAFESNGVFTHSHGSLTNPTAKDLFPCIYKPLDSPSNPPSYLLGYSVPYQRKKKNRQPCLEEERVARDSEKEVRNDTVRF